MKQRRKEMIQDLALSLFLTLCVLMAISLLTAAELHKPITLAITAVMPFVIGQVIVYGLYILWLFWRDSKMTDQQKEVIEIVYREFPTRVERKLLLEALTEEFHKKEQGTK